MWFWIVFNCFFWHNKQLNFWGSKLMPKIAKTRKLYFASLVLAYVFGFMVLVSAYEAAARPKVAVIGYDGRGWTIAALCSQVTYPGMFSKSIISIGRWTLLSYAKKRGCWLRFHLGKLWRFQKAHIFFLTRQFEHFFSMFQSLGL